MTTRPTIAPVLLLLVALLLVGACSGRRGPAPPMREATRVTVQNQSWLSINVYVVAGGQRVRLGTVSGNSTTSLRIPDHVVGLGRDVSFLADPIGSQEVARSFEMYVRPGDEVTITIPPQVR